MQLSLAWLSAKESERRLAMGLAAGSWQLAATTTRARMNSSSSFFFFFFSFTNEHSDLFFLLFKYSPLFYLVDLSHFLGICASYCHLRGTIAY